MKKNNLAFNLIIKVCKKELDIFYIDLTVYNSTVFLNNTAKCKYNYTFEQFNKENYCLRSYLAIFFNCKINEKRITSDIKKIYNNIIKIWTKRLNLLPFNLEENNLRL